MKKNNKKFSYPCSQCNIRLPKITSEIQTKFSEWIENGDWSQSAVDFACFLKECCIKYGR